jgi:hypothetical protein
MASDGDTDDYFGRSVSISGDYAVVGAYGDDIGAEANQGSAYVFIRSGTVWTQQAKLTVGLANDFFGFSVSISGSTIIAGAYGDNIGANINQGSAYIYTRTGTIWIYQAKLTASDGDFDDRFGASVSIIGSLPYQFAIVGAYLDDIGANADQGSVYSFWALTNPGGWISGQAHHQKIIAIDGDAGDFFGVSVSMSQSNINNQFIIIGASGDDVGANGDQGSAYTYARIPNPPFAWVAPAKITAPDGAANDNFGISVGRSLSYAVVGAYRDDGIGGTMNQGSAYLFNASGNFLFYKRKIDDDDGETDGYFGFSVAISGFEVIIGAYGKDNFSGRIGFLNVQ